MKTILLFFGGYICHTFSAFSQVVEMPSSQKWGVETELFQPFYPTVQIIRIQATKRLTPINFKNHGELIIGVYIRPNVKHDVVEKINEYMLVVGYRQYLWKGLHIEAKSNMGYAWGTKNLIDGKNYETPTWFWETNVGYKLNLIKKGENIIYLTPQFGGLGNIIADIGPRGGKPDNFLHGNILLGINF
ncbi:hypothetical protein VB796_18735 [Arcicella sp. LKC2W]|uniref:hypothetical protein n=1 Tax=Arcicella sp. LKC2W TaxID=2984198 RepID=UPI002B1F7C7E|nr:hypothetical protein [Arcicella sp. LKC2W]MEA5461106.1 hypothetical protein [Arcicella sp. LKC2W]